MILFKAQKAKKSTDMCTNVHDLFAASSRLMTRQSDDERKNCVDSRKCKLDPTPHRRRHALHDGVVTAQSQYYEGGEEVSITSIAPSSFPAY